MPIDGSSGWMPSSRPGAHGVEHRHTTVEPSSTAPVTHDVNRLTGMNVREVGGADHSRGGDPAARLGEFEVAGDAWRKGSALHHSRKSPAGHRLEGGHLVGRRRSPAGGSRQQPWVASAAMMSDGERVQLTTSCRDTDAIPKVAGAGAVVVTPEGRVQVMHSGVLVVEGCYYGDWMAEIIRRLRGHHEPQEELVFHEIVERIAADTPAPTMLELGAFWGYYSLWMMQRLPGTRAILVEPDPNNLEVGRVNLALNGRRAEVLQAAVGLEPRPPHPFTCESDGRTRLIPTESLQSLLERFAVPRLDLVLMDVQGAETATLEGAREFLAERVRFLVLSSHHHLISGDPLTHQRCLDLLRGLGAHIIAEHTIAESFSGDGLIAVSFDPADNQMEVPISYARVGESLFGDPLHDLAGAQEAQRATAARLELAETELAVARAELAGARAEYDSAQADAVSSQADLAAMTATTRWRLHRRLQRSRTGRAILRAGSRAKRVR
jgi:FkbM family methyltransferase